jgi:prophage DNA circulation protein
MSRFDLSDAADFSRLTQGAIKDINALLGGRDPAEWDILEASYNGIKFHVFESKSKYQAGLSRVVDSGGRRKVKYQFPYRDGQTTDDLGRKPGSFEMEAVLHGQRYMDGYRALMAEFDKPTPGKLVHPVRGELTCVVEEHTVTHQSDQRKAVALRLVFIEHNFTIGNIRELTDSSVKGALAAALEVFAIIDTALAKIEAAQLLVRGLKNLLKSYLAVYKRGSAQTLTKMNQTFNSKGGSADIPALLPVNVGGTGIGTSAAGKGTDGTTASSFATTGSSSSSSTATGSSGPTVGGSGSSSYANSSLFVVARTLNDPFNGVPVADLSAGTLLAVAVDQLTKEVAKLRESLTTILVAIDDGGASLELFDTKLDLLRTSALIQEVLEKGAASSNARIIDYTVPRLMSLREVAFANGLDVERVEELDLLNPQLLSLNYIEKGTVLKVPVA